MPPKINDKQILDNYDVYDDIDYNEKVFKKFECKHCHNFFKNMHATNARAHLSTLVYAKKNTIQLCQNVPKEIAEVRIKSFYKDSTVHYNITHNFFFL